MPTRVTDVSRGLLSAILRREFDKSESDRRTEDVIQIARDYDLHELADEMQSDYKSENN